MRLLRAVWLFAVWVLMVTLGAGAAWLAIDLAGRQIGVVAVRRAARPVPNGGESVRLARAGDPIGAPPGESAAGGPAKITPSGTPTGGPASTAPGTPRIAGRAASPPQPAAAPPPGTSAPGAQARGRAAADAPPAARTAITVAEPEPGSHRPPPAGRGLPVPEPAGGGRQGPGPDVGEAAPTGVTPGERAGAGADPLDSGAGRVGSFSDRAGQVLLVCAPTRIADWRVLPAVGWAGRAFPAGDGELLVNFVRGPAEVMVLARCADGIPDFDRAHRAEPAEPPERAEWGGADEGDPGLGRQSRSVSRSRPGAGAAGSARHSGGLPPPRG